MLGHKKETLMIFDIIGSYFIDVFYNRQYLLAVSQSKITDNTITDIYRNNLVAYIQGITVNENNFKQTALDLHSYSLKSGMTMTLFTEFQDKLLSKFIPPEYYPSFTNIIKDETLRAILIYSATELLHYILNSNTFKKIIDNHRDEHNVSMLQDHMVVILSRKREEYYNKFAAQICAKKDTVDTQLMQNLKRAYIEEKKLSFDLRSELASAVNIINKLNELIAEQKEIINKYELERVQWVNSTPIVEPIPIKNEPPIVDAPKIEDNTQDADIKYNISNLSIDDPWNL